MTGVAGEVRERLRHYILRCLLEEVRQTMDAESFSAGIRGLDLPAPVRAAFP